MTPAMTITDVEVLTVPDRGDSMMLVVVETSSRADYTPTRRFYEARGYTRTATIPGYYAPGDDLVIYTKDLTAGDLARAAP